MLVEAGCEEACGKQKPYKKKSEHMFRSYQRSGKNLNFSINKI